LREECESRKEKEGRRVRRRENCQEAYRETVALRRMKREEPARA